MRRRAVVLVSAVLVLAPVLAAGSAQAAPAASAPAAPPVAAPLPPDLLRLEQAMLALRLTSERFSASVSVSGSGAPSGPLGVFSRVLASAASSLAFITVTGEVGFAPPMASFQINFLGIKLGARLIGTTLYTEEPFIASLDGGRPWVERDNQHLEQASGVELGTLGGRPGSGATQAFGALVEELGRARSIRELGTQTVDGQATTGFDATVDLNAVQGTTPAQRRAVARLLKPLAHLEVFIADDGLPVRVLLRLAIREKHPTHHAEVITQEDVLAVNVPVVVTPPPAQETITEAQLQRLEAAQLQRLKRRLRRRSEGPRSLTG